MLPELLTKVAYVYNDGPFKGLLVRRGFDPESEVTTRFYQSLSVRLSEEQHKSIILR